MELLHYILSFIEVTLFVYFGLMTSYIFIYAVAGLFYKQIHLKKVKKLRKFAVLIPGYKEDAVIVNVAKEALKQNYPSDKFEIIVIADSFKSETLTALRKLPIRVVEVVFEISKKSKALNKCMEIIGDNYDIALILDADNIMQPDVLQKINETFERGFVAVQGHRTAKNLNTNFAVLDAMSEEINNHIFRKGHRVLGMSSALIGSGMGIDYKLFKSIMATVDSVGEDKEVELKLIRRGIKIEYINDAIIYDEKTQKSDVFVNQRRRWIAAQLSYFYNYFFDGVIQLLKKGNIDFFDKVIQMVIPPRIILAGVIFITAFILGIFKWFNINVISDLFVLSYIWWELLFVITAITLFISLPRKFYNAKSLKAVLYIPLGFFLMLLSLFKIKGANKKFIHTTHSHDNSNTIKHN
jgi:cellulose synthase/poly-beta-1,6-N-acetylglucosamine synthase-like glycosyltransferase